MFVQRKHPIYLYWYIKLITKLFLSILTVIIVSLLKMGYIYKQSTCIWFFTNTTVELYFIFVSCNLLLAMRYYHFIVCNTKKPIRFFMFYLIYFARCPFCKPEALMLRLDFRKLESGMYLRVCHHICACVFVVVCMSVCEWDNHKPNNCCTLNQYN